MTTRRSLPKGVEKYSQSPVFKAGQVPERLQKSHTTKEGVYGRLVVSAGEVEFFLTGQTAPLAVIKPGDAFIILPREEHFVRVSEDAEFCVEFCK